MSIADLRIAGEDKIKRKYLLPKRILWHGDGVSNDEVMLTSTLSQIYVSVPNVTKLSTEKGKKGAVLLDFGCEIVGGVELLVSKVSNLKGVHVNLRFGESDSEAMSSIGEKNATNDHAIRDMEIILTAWSQQIFGYTGYRFVYIELLDEEAWIDFAAVKGVLMIRDIPYLGSFECEDELLGRIYNVSAYTVHLNMQNMLWDGVKRDRLVWIGDTHPEMLAIRTVFGENDIVDDALRFIPQTNLLPEWPNKHATYGFWYLMILWDWYWYTGNLELVLELKPYWIGLTRRLFGVVHENDEKLLREEELKCGFFIDWPTKGTEEAEIGTYALFRLAMLAAAKLSELVGEIEIQEKCLRIAELFAKKRLPHNNRKQIVALLELADMIDKDTAGDILTKDGGKGMSTFMSYYILQAVADTVGVESALNMLREYYGSMLDAGATTFWEDFNLEWAKDGARIDMLPNSGEYDIHGDNGSFCYQGMRHSLCHGWSAGPAAFLAERILGIQILEAGCRKVKIRPEMGNLSYVKGTYPTPYGVIRVDAWKHQGNVLVSISNPAEIEIIK